MLVVITGSSGQIGTNLAHRCLGAGHRVLGIDVRPNQWSARVPTVLADLAAIDPFQLLQLVDGERCTGEAMVVVHLAAHAKVHHLVQEPTKAFDNMLMLRSALELCRHMKAPLIFSSSREVYGDVERECTSEEHAEFARSASPYAACKLACESMIHAYTRCYGLRHLIFRLSNVYGRYDNDLERMTRVVPLFLRQIANGLPVTVYGSEKVLDFTYVDDCVDGLMAGLQGLRAGAVQNHTINLARGQGQSLVMLAERIGQVLGMHPQVRVAPIQTGEIRRYVADLGKARSLLGFDPQVSLHDGVAKAVEWANAGQAERMIVAK